MKLLAFSDTYIPFRYMAEGLASLKPLGVQVEVRSWEHPTLIQLQEANLAIESGGPQAVPLPPELVRDLDHVEILVVQFAPVSRFFLDQAPALKAIGVLRTGLENIAMVEATARGIAVLNTPGRNARAVAECTVGLILAEIRNLARAHAHLVQGRWRRSFANAEAIPELFGKTVGLAGFGAVGRLVAHFLGAFEARILVFDPYALDLPPSVTAVGLEDLLRQSDIVSLHARLSAETRGLIGEAQLRLMKPSAILVNTARSGLVDEAALIRVLAERRIMGAALDVFDIEPLPADHPFLSLDNVTLAPHLAGSTVDAFRNSPRLMAQTLVGMLTGGQGLPVVNGVEPALRAGPPGGKT